MSTFWKNNGLNVKASNIGDNHNCLLMGEETGTSVSRKLRTVLADF